MIKRFFEWLLSSEETAGKDEQFRHPTLEEYREIEKLPGYEAAIARADEARKLVVHTSNCFSDGTIFYLAKYPEEATENQRFHLQVCDNCKALLQSKNKNAPLIKKSSEFPTRKCFSPSWLDYLVANQHDPKILTEEKRQHIRDCRYCSFMLNLRETKYLGEMHPSTFGGKSTRPSQ
jgi:hypothetical protein